MEKTWEVTTVSVCCSFIFLLMIFSPLIILRTLFLISLTCSFHCRLKSTHTSRALIFSVLWRTTCLQKSGCWWGEFPSAFENDNFSFLPVYYHSNLAKLSFITINLDINHGKCYTANITGLLELLSEMSDAEFSKPCSMSSPRGLPSSNGSSI